MQARREAQAQYRAASRKGAAVNKMNPESVPPGMLFPKLLCDLMIHLSFQPPFAQRYEVVEVRYIS